jgi:hypothetical protein
MHMPRTKRPRDLGAKMSDESTSTSKPRLTLYQQILHALENRLAPYLREGFFFVNIGANDGVASDPLPTLIRKYRARGLFVEPVPYVFERLRRNYSDMPDLIFENAAVSAVPRSFWYVEQGSGSMDYVMSQIGSLDREHLVGTIKNLRLMGDAPDRVPPMPEGHLPPRPHEGPQVTEDVEDFIRELPIATYTFNELMEKHGIEQIDFLNTDTEGFDLELVNSIDFDRYRPTIMCLETIEFPDGECDRVEAKLFAMGYRFVQRFGPHSRVYARERD